MLPPGPRSTYNIEYEISLSSLGDASRVRIRTGSGNVEAFMLQYETLVATQPYQVVRYDVAHGYAHRDLLNHEGDVIDKRPMSEHLGRKEALQEAMGDLKSNWHSYRENFVARLP